MKTFQQFINEHVLSIGINPAHEHHREKYRHDIHDVLHKSYVKAGGYGGHASGSEKESAAIHADISNSLIKATTRDGKISSVAMYKQSHGRKSIAAGTDSTTQGKKDWHKTALEDHEQKRAWGEASGAVEAIKNKMNVPVIPAHVARDLLKKDIKIHADGQHYSRVIGDHEHTKIAMGHYKK
jgi:hypothetical protein